ncbi:MAG: fibronectin type III domain-containing protein, partial [Acetobacterium sp.]
VIKVTAQDNSTATYTITMASTLEVPTAFRAVAGNELIELHWSTVANAVSYKVYQSTTSGTGYSEVVNLQSSSSYQVLNLTPGQTYYFVVKAVATGYNDSLNSLEVSAIANVTPSGSEISGNQLIISNESTDLATQSTGTLSSIITPPMNELNTEGMEGPIRINPEIPLRNSPDQSTLDASMIPSVSSAVVSDIKTFYTYNYTTTSYDQTIAHCAYVGPNVEVWVENNATPVQLTDSEAATIGQEFDNNIYGLVTTNFFAASDVDNNGKIDILCFDIKDGYTGGGYIGGYYDPNNQVAGTYSNQMDMIFVDTNPLIGTEKNLPKSYSTLAHELQHLVNFNCNKNQGGQMATWLNESLSQAAEQMYNGVQADRITYFNNSTVITDGRSVMDWTKTDSLPNYSLSYLFGQYLRTQAEQKLDAGVKTDIFKQILVDPGNETTALTNAIHNNIDASLSLGNVLTNFRVAMALKATTGVYGFGNDAAAFSGITPKVSTLTATDLKGGGAIVKDISAGPFTVPTIHGSNVTYTGVY